MHKTVLSWEDGRTFIKGEEQHSRQPADDDNDEADDSDAGGTRTGTGHGFHLERMKFHPHRQWYEIGVMGLIGFALLGVRFSPNWRAFYQDYSEARAHAKTDAHRSAIAGNFGGTFSTQRGTEVAKQVVDLNAENTDMRHRIVRWRLLMPALGHFLKLPVWLVLSMAHLGCLMLVMALVALIFRHSDGSGRSLLDAMCFGVVAGASAPFMTSMGWLGYYDSWLAIGLIVVAFVRPRWWIVLACLLTPWIDERFVLGVPLALCVRWIHFEPAGENDFSWFKNECTLPLMLVLGFAFFRLRLGGSGASQTVGDYFNTFIFGRKVEITRLLFGAWAGLRVGWLLVVMAVLGIPRTPAAPPGLRMVLLGIFSVISVFVGLFTAMDLSRSMVLVITMVPLGWLFAARAEWWRKFYMAPALAVTALALPASHVMSDRIVPVDNLWSPPFSLVAAESNLGIMYSKGDGVPKDSAEALKWCRKAAEHGLAEAQSNLGIMYSNGDGVPKDSVEAVKWWRKAAEQGMAQAQYNLGVMYATGDGGMSKDGIEALALFTLAAEGGDGLAIENRKILEHNLGRESALAARKRSKELSEQIKGERRAR